MKKYFITGLVILLPLAVTLAVIVFIFNLLTEPFAGCGQRYLESLPLVGRTDFSSLQPDRCSFLSAKF